MFETKKQILIVGGTFDNENGKPSGLINKITQGIKTNDNWETTLINGGHYDQIKNILDTTPQYDAVAWFPNVPNEYEKVRNVKDIAPKTLLIVSKRNDNETYSNNWLTQRALSQKANLLIEFKKIEATTHYTFRIIDPLSNLWYEGDNPIEAGSAMAKRLDDLTIILRQPTFKSPVDPKILPPYPKKEISEFTKIIQEYASETFKFFADVSIKRFVGNASMRNKIWSYDAETNAYLDRFALDHNNPIDGYPIQNVILVTRRNVPKITLQSKDFVPVYLDVKETNEPTTTYQQRIYYIGENKPSVDTPVQIRLYKNLPNINFMIHTHSYVKQQDGSNKLAPFTQNIIPCGGLQETSEILDVIDRHYTHRTNFRYAINLKGHGSIIMGNTVADLKDYQFEPRPIFERQF